MRYNIMLRVVTSITLVLLLASGFFAWVQNRARPLQPQQSELQT